VSSLSNAGVDNKLGRFRTGNLKRHCQFKSEAYTMVEDEPKDEVATIEREFKLRKRITVFFGSFLITVPLHLTYAVNNLS